MARRIFYILLTALSLLIDIQPVTAQTDNAEQCRQLIRKAYKKINVSGKNSTSATLIHYTTRISMWNKEQTPDTETEIKLITANKQIQFLTKEASFYSDEKDVFLVIHRTMELIRNKAVLTQEEENFFIKQTVLIQDSLLLTSTMSVCQDMVQKDGSILRKVELIPPFKTRKLYKIEKVVFLVDKTSETIKKIQISYTKESEIKQIDNYYHSVETNYKVKLETPVYYLFFDKKNRLLPNYKNFNYIDNTL